VEGTEDIMTGAYLRVKRDGKWDNVEVEHLTDQERHHTFIDRTPKELVKWLNLVCNKLATTEPLLKGLEDEGILQRR
jgi:hypothetical protein